MTVPLVARSSSRTTRPWSAAGLRLVLDAEPDLEVVAEAADGSTRSTPRSPTESSTSQILDVAMPRKTGLQAARDTRTKRLPEPYDS